MASQRQALIIPMPKQKLDISYRSAKYMGRRGLRPKKNSNRELNSILSFFDRWRRKTN